MCVLKRISKVYFFDNTKSYFIVHMKGFAKINALINQSLVKGNVNLMEHSLFFVKRKINVRTFGNLVEINVWIHLDQFYQYQCFMEMIFWAAYQRKCVYQMVQCLVICVTIFVFQYIYLVITHAWIMYFGEPTGGNNFLGQ